MFVGYERDQVGKGRFLGGLPSRYRPVVRSRLLYGSTERLGINYTYDYDVSYASSGYENKFFSTLSKLAEPAPLTELQQQYNDQQSNVLEVTGNHYIDAPTVERWLASHPPAGVDTRRNTIFFVNWYGRPDFKFHVYTKTDEPDPDTGFNFGVEADSRKLIAWGGTTPDDEENGLGKLRRVWFYDLSAGPESWTDNWNVDDADLDGDGVLDYRMPPIWEYTRGGFRAPSALSGDLAKVARYVFAGFLGFADDNYRNGTQSFVFNFVSPSIAEAYGLTTTMIHEDGHHLGMSHPHDAYDSETGVDYEPTGPYYFAWSGDESNSMMSYIDLNWDFSQFDRDNMNRFLATAFNRNANRIAADILADPDAGVAADELATADRLLGASKAAFARHQYLAAVFLAKSAYDQVRRGARQAGVPVVGSTEGWEVEGAGSDTAAARKVADGSSVDHLGPHSHRLRR